MQATMANYVGFGVEHTVTYLPLSHVAGQVSVTTTYDCHQTCVFFLEAHLYKATLHGYCILLVCVMFSALSVCLLVNK